MGRSDRLLVRSAADSATEAVSTATDAALHASVRTATLEAAVLADDAAALAWLAARRDDREALVLHAREAAARAHDARVHADSVQDAAAS